MTNIKSLTILAAIFFSGLASAATYEFRYPLKGVISNESAKAEPSVPEVPEPEKDVERGQINKPAYCLNAALYMDYRPTQNTTEFRTFTGFTNYCNNNWNYDEAYFEKYAYLDCDKIAANEQKLKGGATDKNTIMTESNKCLQGSLKPTQRVDYYPPVLYTDKNAFCVAMVAFYNPETVDIPVLFDICMNEPDGSKAPIDLKDYRLMSAIVSADPTIYPVLDNPRYNFTGFSINTDTITIRIKPAPANLSLSVKTITVKNNGLRTSYKCTDFTKSEITLGVNKTLQTTFTCKGDFKNIYAPSANYTVSFAKS